MARYLPYQNEIEIEIDSDNDLRITQTDAYGEEQTIFVNVINIDWFMELILMARKDGFQREGD